MLDSVLLPAPFSPSRAWTSPTRASKSTWSFASTPGKRFVMPRIVTAGSPSAGAACGTDGSVELMAAAWRTVGGRRSFRRPPPCRPSALRAAFDSLDEPVDREDVAQGHLLPLRDPELAGLVVDRALELVERPADDRLLLRGDRGLGLGRDLRPERGDPGEAVGHAAVVAPRLPGAVHGALDLLEVVRAPVVNRGGEPRGRRELLRVAVVADPRQALGLCELARGGAVDVLPDHVCAGSGEALGRLLLLGHVEPRLR